MLVLLDVAKIYDVRVLLAGPALAVYGIILSHHRNGTLVQPQAYMSGGSC